ncbi:integrase core domain-containing protein, partial [Paracoccus fontiphilus]
SRVSCSSSLHEGYDEPETLCHAIGLICPMGADVRHDRSGVAEGLVLRHDHGSNYMSGDFQREIRFLGMTSSPAFVRQPEGNGVAERAIRTLKEQLLWVRHFATVEELRLALAAFAALYNANWLRERHGHKTPDQIRAEQRALETEAATGFKLAA